MRSIKLRGLVLAPLVVMACSDAPTVCEDALVQFQQQADVSDWRAVADSLLAEAPPDLVLHIVVFLHPQRKQAFVDWAVSTGGGFGPGPTYYPPDSIVPLCPREGRRNQTCEPPFESTVDAVIIWYEFTGFSGYSVYLPVWALEGLKEQDIAGVDFGIGAGDLPQC
jgi:hypothetical protein